MIIYSIIPNEIIFNNSNINTDFNFIEMDYLGEKVQVSALSNNRYVINRVIATNPKSFLNPKLQPGSIIESEAKNT